MYHFDFTRYLIPVVTDFNKEVIAFSERIEKEIDFCQTNKFSSFHDIQEKNIVYDPEIQRIQSISYSRKKGLQLLGSFTIYPRWDGKFDLAYVVREEKLAPIKGVSITSFLGRLSGETMDDLKMFWQNHCNKKIA